MSDVVEQLNALRASINTQLNEVAMLLQRVPAEMAVRDLDALAPLHLAIENLKEIVETGKSEINKSETILEEYFCKKILEVGLNHKHDLGTFSADVKGFFSVNDAQALLGFLSSKKGTKRLAEKAPLMRLCELMQYKKELTKFCEGILEDGEPLPAGIAKHMVAKVTVRRSDGGKEREV